MNINQNIKHFKYIYQLVIFIKVKPSFILIIIVNRAIYIYSGYIHHLVSVSYSYLFVYMGIVS